MKVIPKLSGMPAEIKMMIYEDLDFNTRFRVRRCSKSDRDAIDNLPFHYKNIRLFLSRLAVRITFSNRSEEFENCDESHELKYTQTPVGTHVQHFWKENVVKSHEVLNSYSHDIAFADFGYLLSHKKLKIDCLSIRIDKEFLNASEENGATATRRVSRRVQKILRKRTRKLKVKRLMMENFVNEEGLLRLLPYLCPATLIEIKHRKSVEPSVVLNLEQVAQLEQWKRAKYCQMLGFFINGPIANWLHFSVLRTRVESLSVEEFDLIVQNYIQTKHFVHLEFALIGTDCTLLKDHINSLAPPELKTNKPLSARNIYRMNKKQCLFVALNKLGSATMLTIVKLGISMEEWLLKVLNGHSVFEVRSEDFEIYLKETA